MNISRKKIDEIMMSLNSAVVLSGILKHNGTISVPLEEFESLVDKVQMWPNDYLTQNFGEGHMMVLYNDKKNSLDFSLGRSGDFVDVEQSPVLDSSQPQRLLGFTCLRNMAKFGYVNHDSPRYRD